MQLSSKKDDSSLCNDVIITVFRIISILTLRQTYLEMLRISLIINQCDPRRPKRASGGHKVSACFAAQASGARCYI